MKSNKNNLNILPYMAYGDALGFSEDNSGSIKLQAFFYLHNKDIKIQMQKGQWSYITQLTLINCKCLVDNKEKNRVMIDYVRLSEEIKLWKYYRCATPLNYMHKLDLNKNYYSSDFYWEDKKGEAFSRIIPIALANKNFSAAQEEVYKNIVYTNRHPQVILTALLLLRTVYLLINNSIIGKEELINKLKDYLIELKLSELEHINKTQLQNKYKITFEQEKVNYLIDLDRIKVSTNISSTDTPYSKDILILAIINFFKLYEEEDIIRHWTGDKKELYTITYALLALAKQTDKIEADQIKDAEFIKSMNEYLFKLSEYEIGRMFFEGKNKEVDIFKLQKGMKIKHPLLNNIIVKDKKKSEGYIELTVCSKTGEYRFLKKKN